VKAAPQVPAEAKPGGGALGPGASSLIVGAGLADTSSMREEHPPQQPWFVLVSLAAIAASGCSTQEHSTVGTWPDSTAEAYRGSVAALMWPGATRAYQVTADGDLFNGAWFVRVHPSVDGVRASSPAVIAYEDRWCPVVHWSRRARGVRWDFEAVAIPEPEPRPWSSRGLFARLSAAWARQADTRAELASFASIPKDSLARVMLRVRHPIEREPIDRRNFYVALRGTATNEGLVFADARLTFACEPHGDSPPYWDADSLVATPWEHCWATHGQTGAFLGLADGAVFGRSMVNRWRLGPGQQVIFRAVLPAYPTPARELRTQARIPQARQVARARAYWLHETSRGATFDVPDVEVRDAIRAARVVLLSCRERRDDDWVPIANPFQYRDVWIRDGARVIEALAVSGYDEEANSFARAFLRFQAPLGNFTSQSAQLDGTGQALWAFEQALLRSPHAVNLQPYARAAESAWRALEYERLLTSHAAAGSVRGMLPETDPHDAELVRAQLIGNDAWALVGYRSAARLLRAAGNPGMADSVERSRERYLSAFQLGLQRTGQHDVAPTWQSGGIDWGNLNVGYPCEVLPADDTHLSALAARYWAPVSGPGLGYYGNPDSLHTYVAADLGTWAMLRGDRIMADKVISAVLHWRTASGGAAECFVGSRRDFGHNFPPHGTAAAALISLVRNALLFDDRDTLELTLGARSTWWQGTTVRAAPTRWGRIDLHFFRDRGSASWTWTPVPVWTVLALPPGTRLAGMAPAPLRPGPRPDLLLAPPGTTSARVALAP
jgi:hypothetical protein